MTLRVTLREFVTHPIKSGHRRLFDRLERLEATHAANRGERIFDWPGRDRIRAKNWVGVVAVPGLEIEILPKLGIGSDEALARQNFAFMLAVGGHLPFHDRDLAGQETLKRPLLDMFIAAFVARFREEVRRGVDHAYHEVEETSSFIRGKLLVGEQIRKNSSHRERFEVRYASFGIDTAINRVLRAACRRLVRIAGNNNRRDLRRIIEELDDVDDASTTHADFSRIAYTRNTERFRPLVDFAKLVFEGRSPVQTRGDSPTFSLLFPMETVFESFVAGFIRRHASMIGISPQAVHTQAEGRGMSLMRDSAGRSAYALKPDIVIDRSLDPVVIDTKWKHIDEDMWGRMRPKQSDMYQIYAYATRYLTSRAILLYPKSPGVAPLDFVIEGDVSRSVAVRFLDVSRDLRNERRAIAMEFMHLINGTAEVPP